MGSSKEWGKKKPDDWEDLSDEEKERRSVTGCGGMIGLFVLSVTSALFTEPIAIEAAKLLNESRCFPAECLFWGVVWTAIFTVSGKDVKRWINESKGVFLREVPPFEERVRNEDGY